MRTEPVTARRFGVGVIAAMALLTSACAAGQHAQTADQKPTLDGTETTIGTLELRGLAIQSPVTAPYYKPGSDALVKLVIVNTGNRTDALTGITSSAFSGWSAYSKAADAERVQATDGSPPVAAASLSSAAPSNSTSASAGSAGTSAAVASPPAPPPVGTRSVPVPAGARVSWGVPDATGGLLMMKFKKAVYPGTTVPVTFTFANNGSKTIPVPIMLTTGPNESVLPGPSATGQVG